MTTGPSDQRKISVANGPHVIGARLWDGDGPLLVLTHGAGLCAGMFAPLADAVRDRFRCVAIDGRGHGDSARPDDPSGYALDRQASDVIAVLDHLGCDEAVAFGHSFGGAVLLRVALDHPGRLRALLAHEPAIGHPGDSIEDVNRTARGLSKIIEARDRQWATIEELRAAVASWPTMREVADEFLDAFIASGTERTPGGWQLRCPPEVEALLFRLTLSPLGGNGMHDTLHQLATSPLRCTVSCGAGSARRMALYQWLAGTLSCELVEVPGHHLAPFRDLGETLNLVVRYCREDEMSGGR